MADLKLDLPSIERKESNWCWASCAKMIISYYDVNTLDQCDFANFLFGKSHCCRHSSDNECNCTATINQINKLYQWFGIYFDFNNYVMPFKELEYQIVQGCPVQVSWRLKSGGGHVLLVIGTGVGSKGEYVHINDPHAGYLKMPYTSLIDAGGKGEWDYTWKDLQPL